MGALLGEAGSLYAAVCLAWWGVTDVGVLLGRAGPGTSKLKGGDSKNCAFQSWC